MNKKEIPDSTLSAVLGEKRFTYFLKIRDCITKTLGLEFYYCDSKSRRGKYYIAYNKVYNQDENNIINEMDFVSFAVDNNMLSVEIGVTMSVWEKIVQNINDFCEEPQKNIKYDIAAEKARQERNYISPHVEHYFCTHIFDENTFNDVIRVIKWEYEYRRG